MYLPTIPNEEPFPVLSNINYKEVAFHTDDVPNDDVPIIKSIFNEFHKEIEETVKSYSELFSGICETDLVTQYIETTNDAINLPSYPLHIHLKDKAAGVIWELLRAGIISHNASKFSSPVVLVKKVNSDKVWVTIDYRVTNEYLGFTITANQVTVSNKKVESIKNYPVPKSVKGITKFLGLADFYRNQLSNYSEILSPLSVIQCNIVKFCWTDECQKCFERVINLLFSSSVVLMPNAALRYILKIDSSKFGIGCILEQEDPSSKQRYVI